MKNVIEFNRSTDIEDYVYVPSEENPNINYHKLLTTRYDEDLKRIEKQVSCLRTSFKILVQVILPVALCFPISCRLIPKSPCVSMTR